MNLQIKVGEAVGTLDIFGAPFDVANRIVPELSAAAPTDGTLAISVPEVAIVQDNLGTYKRWFNGVKHFYMVKPAPPTVPRHPRAE